MNNKIVLTMVSKIAYILSFFAGVIAFAQPSRPNTNPVNPGGGAGAVGPGGRPVPTTPIDMYEGALVILAIAMIVGYYLYTRNKKAIA